MAQIEELSDSDIDAFITIVANAYPALRINTQDERRQWREDFIRMRAEESTRHQYGLWRDGRLVGGMRLFDFVMNLFGTKASVGGVGLVAADFYHKKEHIAKDLIDYFLRHYRERGAVMTSLYAFRHDFYRKMGFGYGTKLNQYRVGPAALPRGPSKEHVVPLERDDIPLLRACYQRVADQTHGMFDRSERSFQHMFDNPAMHLSGCKQNGRITGYLAWTFKQDPGGNFFVNDIHVQELMYEDGETLAELLTLFNSQADQIRTVIIDTQDEQFHHLLPDARNDTENTFALFHESNIQGIGITYRVIDLAGVFHLLRDHDWGGQNCKLKIALVDTFFDLNPGSLVLHVEEGRARVLADGVYDVEIRMDVGDFSSLLMGVISFRQLYTYRQAEISDPRHLDTVNRLFFTETKPLCVTRF